MIKQAVPDIKVPCLRNRLLAKRITEQLSSNSVQAKLGARALFSSFLTVSATTSYQLMHFREYSLLCLFRSENGLVSFRHLRSIRFTDDVSFFAPDFFFLVMAAFFFYQQSEDLNPGRLGRSVNATSVCYAVSHTHLIFKRMA